MTDTSGRMPTIIATSGTIGVQGSRAEPTSKSDRNLDLAGIRPRTASPKNNSQLEFRAPGDGACCHPQDIPLLLG